MLSSDTPPGASRSRAREPRYELITLGNELLLGHASNGHLAFIGSQLGRRGIELRRNVTVGDEPKEIVSALEESWAKADVILMTGGLGPTCDDRTRETVASFLGQKLVFDPAIEKHIEARFALFGRKMTPNNLKQAYRFEDGQVLFNANGTAPGLWIEQDGKVLCLLPGPPNELQPMLEDQVIPRLGRLGLLSEKESYIQLRTAGIGESLLETRLQPLFERRGPDLTVAFCAHAGQVDLRLSLASGPFDQLQEIAAECARIIGDDFVCFGHDSLAKACADSLRIQEKRLAIAEAATGGLLSHAFADLCGASKFFAGGCVFCSNNSKALLLDVPECLLMQHGAVSAEAAVAIAAAAAEKLAADYALAITGFAGPCGGPQENPVGTIFVALSAPHGVWSRKYSFPGPRSTVKQRTVNAALDWLRRELARAQTGATGPNQRIDVMQ